MAGPWAKYGTAPAQPAGDQIVKPAFAPTPYQVEDQEFKREDQEFQREDREIKRQELAIKREELATKAGELKEGQAKAAGFLQRAIGANTAYEGTREGPRSYIGETVASIAPRLTNEFDSDSRQQANQAQRDFISAVLRLESGAAISPEEFDSQALIYFPQSGDGDAVIKQKAEARRRALEQLRLQAGAAGEGVEIAPLLPSGATTSGEEDGLQGTVSYEGPNPANAGAPPAPQGETFLGSVGDIVEGAATIPGLVINPVGQALYDVTGYGDHTYDLGTTLREGLGLPRNPDGLLRNVNTFGASALTGGLGARAAAPLAQQGGVTRNVLNTLGQTPIRDTVAGMGAGAGAYGGEQVGGAAGSVAGALGGALGGYAGANALLRASAPRVPNQTALALQRAGQAEGIPVNRAMIDPQSNNAVTKSEASLIGGRTIQREMGAVGDKFEGRVQDLGRGGSPMVNANDDVDRVALGGKIQAAGERFIEKSGASAKRKYDRAEQMAGDAKVTPQESLRRVDEMIATLGETANVNSAELSFLREIKTDLSKDLTVGGLRRMRTKLRKKISKGDLVFGEDEARVLAIMDGAADDIRTGLTQQGKQGAANAFDAADKAYRARMDYITGTVQKLLGKRNSSATAEQIADKFKSMTANDSVGLRKFYATLDPQEQADVAATIAETLGKNGKSNFTVTQFLRQTAKLDDRVLTTIFGHRGAESVRNLRTVGKEIERVTGAMNSNTSKSGIASYRDFAFSLFSGGGLGFLGGGGVTGASVAAAAGLAAKAGLDAVTANMLMSPKITKWLTQAPRTTNAKAINAHFGRLSAIAKQEPALAADIKALQEAMMKAANDNVHPAAVASEGEGQDKN